MTKYYPPSFNEKQFHCIHCGVYAAQQWNKLPLAHNSALTSPISRCNCTHCNEDSFWHYERMIVPAESPVEPAHADMPEAILDDYNEARSIFGRSPRAAAALLRLAVQKLMPMLGQSGDNINSDIKALVSQGLPVQVQQALDYCRVIGNNAVHPGKINLSDTPDMAKNLFDMLNFIVDDLITRPKHIQLLYEQLP
ncbi:hypothetical protein A6M27_09810 [Acidithiobacillus thiooxidans]|uniref:DUF4145 domain-containing protein n=1 Tax=Acidithiobacillus thiooxidans TaxID=930 RepID=A0A1C2II09_ACITH|nr:DUF4145 domain-containing protein [Acidithiobacillus thiooxidans]OCX74444.1 hypothetical protein A6P07_05495 [Acidithiobacillus thiooxidans]OCX75616.1 hypothetical protein A6O24_09695 [Acidithiobacillus thiooxidans]OCX81694.1 hypothetical protein A6O26_12450 [Acidithiobacillus thiooxidans]OCX87930.1 hypothetical protein A6M27_09810 [Acidithiobacillus thiooxidans]